jgi:hypothetical protein
MARFLANNCDSTWMQREQTNLYDVRLQVLMVFIATIPCDLCCFDVSEKRTASIFRVTKLFQRLLEKKFGYPEDRSSTFPRHVGTNKVPAIWRTTPKTVISEITKWRRIILIRLYSDNWSIIWPAMEYIKYKSLGCRERDYVSAITL